MNTVPAGIGLTPMEALDASRLCEAVYLDKAEVHGWRALNAAELGIPDEFFEHQNYVNKNAAAFVRETVVDGQKTLALVFRGSDDIKDWFQNVVNINLHYKLMKPLVEAVDRYVAQRGIGRVIVAGHSLGGAMATLYLREHRDAPPPSYCGVTFGCPGAKMQKVEHDPRMLEFMHSADIVPQISAMLTGRYKHIGAKVVIEHPDWNSRVTSGAAPHTVSGYRRTMESMHMLGMLELAMESVTMAGTTVSLREKDLIPAKDIRPGTPYQPGVALSPVFVGPPKAPPPSLGRHRVTMDLPPGLSREQAIAAFQRQNAHLEERIASDLGKARLQIGRAAVKALELAQLNNPAADYMAAVTEQIEELSWGWNTVKKGIATFRELSDAPDEPLLDGRDDGPGHETQEQPGFWM